MKPLHKLPVLLVTGLLSIQCFAQSSAEIVPSPVAAHVGGIVGDSVIVVSGTTFSFTVDSPEDQGPIATTPGVEEFLEQITAKDGSNQRRRIDDRHGAEKKTGKIENGDRLVITSQDGKTTRTYALRMERLALSGRLKLDNDKITIKTPRDLTLSFTAGQRSPDATVRIFVPAGINPTLENTTVNVIGRGEVLLKDLPKQSIGRVGSAYPYSKVGEVSIDKLPDGSSVLVFKHLDLRPANGADLVIVINDVVVEKAGPCVFKATYTTTQPEVLTSTGTGMETVMLTAIETISDFTRVNDRSIRYKDTASTYTSAVFTWTPPVAPAATPQLMHSPDEGKTWAPIDATMDPKAATASVSGLAPRRLHTFRLVVNQGENKGASNVVQFYSGKRDIKTYGVAGDGKQDDTHKINEAIESLARIGGGTLLFSSGVYNVRTVHLQSNVYLYISKGATINALKGGDAPEATWFSDKKYRSGLSPTDRGPYENPENWLTKQDVGHTFFRNAMFFGERLDNVKIIGNGRISGNGNLVTSDNVMRNAPDNRSDKMFALKLCTNIEIGGIHRDEDLWYDPERDEPYYIGKDGVKIFDVDNMLNIDRGGHFVLLATGTDGINVHNTYFARHATSHARDIYDFMQCNDVTVTNIYSKVSSDDIVKPGSDCSLGFTRPAKKYRVRNIIGDTNCNLFQIGSETVDDITDLCVDNIYVLGANKAGFSISTNDGGHIKDVHLNCGHTGALHSRSKMLRTHTPFFISISNRGRALGATVGRFKFDENGKAHDELLNTNINIGVVENIILNGIDVTEIYGGSSFRGGRWKAYDGTQRKAAPIVAGYQLPASEVVQGGLTFTLPNGKHTGYVKNVVFNDVHFVAKGGNPKTDTNRLPPELGVGQYNASNLGVLPAYGLWARHVEGLTLTNCTFNYETRDSTFALHLENVLGGKISTVKMVRASDAGGLIRLKNARDITIEKATVYDDRWGQSPRELPPVKHVAGDLLIDK